MATLVAQRGIKATRGPELRCKTWRAEAILRMLENNLENGEAPDELIIYAGRAKAARSWEDFDRIVHALMTMEEDQTLVCQSGRAVGLFPTHTLSPMVVMVNGAVSGRKATAEGFEELMAQGLTIMPGMTAAAWQYIGSQGILQGTYESFMAAARQHYGADDLGGRLVVTAGLGGMGGAQPLAGYLAGAATLVADVDARRADRRVREGYLQHRVDDVDDAIRMVMEAKERGEAVSVGVIANIVEVLEALIERGITPDVLTDQTTTNYLRGYIPLGMSADEAAELRDSGRGDELVARGKETIARHVRAMLELQRRGAETFEYGNFLRQQALEAGVDDAYEIEGFILKYIRPLFCNGFGPFRWLAISGNPDDIYTIDDIILENFEGHPVTNWIAKAREHVKFTGLPARIGWMGYGDRHRLGLLVNEAIRAGRVTGPVSFTRDHLDSGSVASPTRETERMRDGTDGVADWPILDALLNASSHADLVAIHGPQGRSCSAGVTVVADGTDQAAERLERVLQNDPGLGVLRHADAGYEIAIEKKRATGLGLRD
jgi:urocanate hydratase